ncbi:MAG: hydrogenase maturation protease [Burkholderiales bacterium]|nr:hydrogenase maturation protease [Burkholderiales bacterium]
MKRAVICVGSPFGDDALGLVAAPLIEARLSPLGVPVLALDRPGVRLLPMLKGMEEVVFVDGVRSGAPPGTVHRFTEEAVLACLARHTSTHGFGLAEAVALSRRLDQGPDRLFLFGIEIGRAEGEGLTPATAAALPRLVAAVCAAVREGERQ